MALKSEQYVLLIALVPGCCSPDGVLGAGRALGRASLLGVLRPEGRVAITSTSTARSQNFNYHQFYIT